MLTFTVVGFPRIGIHRELKFETEKYFRGEISSQQLWNQVSALRLGQWKIQKEAGVSFPPSNDFSLYDGMLDTAFLLGAIPQRYLNLREDDTATYFAMARGYQGKDGDVRALAMKKWFNTNYHYIVPELEDEMELKLRSASFLDGYRQARENGILTRPVVVGPFTFLKLAQCTGKKKTEDFAEEVSAAYQEILKECAGCGVQWLQMDEPSLVTDLTDEDLALFRRLYEKLLASRGPVKVLLQTYFGDVRDCYQEICSLPFDGLGLDFVEGKKTLSLIESQGFPQNKTLFAGLINGKNIWKCRYSSVLDQLNLLKQRCGSLVLSTSCSLLHVPYTVALEERIPEEIRDYFSFALEKLKEMQDLCTLTEEKERESSPAFQKNETLFQNSRFREDPEVRRKVRELKDSDFVREMPRAERQALQHSILDLPLLPTTTIGSFPQTGAVKQNRARYRKGEITEEKYQENVKSMIRDCIRLQEEIGLDVLVHGEFERNDMVEFFGEHLSGFVFTDHAWVQSYGTRGVKPPIIFSDIRREKSITVDYIRYANSLTEKEVKGMLTGPVTIFNWSFPREDLSSQEVMDQIALAIREEVLELEEAGVRIIQIDEAALREKLPLRRESWHSDYLDFAIRAFRLCSSGVRPETQIHTHMCYSEFSDIIPEIDSLDADVITFEASRSNLEILDALAEFGFETETGPGVYDIHSPRVPEEEEIEYAIRLMLKKIPLEKLWINPDCGLKTRGETETAASLKNMVSAAKKVREELGLGQAAQPDVG